VDTSAFDAAREAGMKEVPVIFLRNLTDAEKTRIRIADNGQFGAWDLPKLRLQLETFSMTELPMLGLDAATLDNVAPLGANNDGAEGLQSDVKWEQLKFKVPKAAAKRINSIIE
jgi:ParB-like chromosome segregation protein Spo0J